MLYGDSVPTVVSSGKRVNESASTPANKKIEVSLKKDREMGIVR